MTTTEAVEIYRRLAGTNRAAFEPGLALALKNRGNQLSELGLREEALATTTEAVEIYRRLARTNTAATEPDLATALTNLAADLSAEGRREEAMAAAAEAIEVNRRLAQVNPTTFRPDLALALLNLGVMMSQLGMREEAATATAEAVDLYRQLAQVNSAAFEADLASALINVAMMLISLERQEEALTSTREAVEVCRRLAQLNPAAFRPKLARALRAAAAAQTAGKVELPQALDAAEQSAAIYQDLAASHPAKFTDDLIAAQHTVADVLDSLGKGEEASHIRRRVNATSGLLAVSRVVVGDDIQEELDEAGMAQVTASLYPADCQTCGRPLRSAPPVLHVNDFDSYASAALHHSGCKSSEWNRAASGVLIIRGTSEPVLTWTSVALAVPVTVGASVTKLFPMLLVNPSLESVRLERDSSGRWRVQLEPRFRNAGLVPSAELRWEPITVATARIKNCEVSLTIRGRSESYEASFPDEMTMDKIRDLGGLIFAVTHAVNPVAVTTMRDLEPVLVGDRSLMGWVKIEG